MREGPGGSSQPELSLGVWINDPRQNLPQWLADYVEEPRRHDFTFLLRTAVGTTAARHRVQIGDVVIAVNDGLPVIVRRLNAIGAVR